MSMSKQQIKNQLSNILRLVNTFLAMQEKNTAEAVQKVDPGTKKTEDNL